MIEIIEKKFEIIGAVSTISAVSKKLRDQSQAIIDHLDFPNSKDEAWKYTRTTKIKNTNFTIDKEIKLLDQQIEQCIIPGEFSSILVFVNGFYQEKWSNIQINDSLEIIPLSQAHEGDWTSKELGAILPLEKQLFNAINTYYATDGVSIHFKKKAQILNPIQCVFITTGNLTYAGIRNVISFEDFSEAKILFNFQSVDANSCFSHAISEIHIGANANLTIDKIQLEAASNFCLATEQVKQEKDSTFTINTITLDGLLVRNDLNIAVAGQNSETNLSGAYVLKGKQHVDNHTVVDHMVANCNSNELYKGVIDEQATAVFNGKVFVRQDAQKINAFQSNGNVLLSDSATINSKPELEIYADDVKCSHGSTTGQLDEEAIFYLRARGLSEKSARALMVSAFIGDVLDKIESESLRSYLDGVLLEKYGWVI